MSCQSLTPARAFTDDKELAHCASIHRTVRFSSESRNSTRGHDSDSKRETPGSMSLMTLSVTPATSSGGYATAMSQSAPPTAATFDLDDLSAPELPSCRFPKLEECAHFHYERVSLGGLRIETVPRDESEQCTTHTGESVLSEGWICLLVRSHVNEPSSEGRETRSLSASWTEASDVREWTLTRSAHNFIQLDDTLHRCIYDRKVSGLPNLSETINAGLIADRARYTSLISDYVHHLSIIADDSINCGPALNWLQIDNKGHKLLVASEDCHSINTPAVAAAYSVRKYVSQARDEISFDVGDMISIIDMPGPQESIWWRGKRGFRVGFFPHHCVAVIGDKVPRHMTQPPPIVGSVAVAPIKPVLRKHGKLISLFRSFILSRPSRRSLKQMGILRERVFGCDLGEHLLNCGHEVPLVLVECARVIEERGAVDGIYRLSGGSGLTQRLRAAFDEGRAPDLTCAHVARDPHATASLLKMYFRELPNPLCTYQLYEHFVSSVQAGPDESVRLQRMRETVVKLPPPHYRTLAYLMRHLRRVSLLGESTGMTARNMAIVWAPNLLRSPVAQHALQGVAVQAVVTEFLICYAEDLFSLEQGADCSGDSSDDQKDEFEVELRGMEAGRRPKSLPLGHRAKLLSLEEARQRGKSSVPTITSPCLPPPSGAIAAAAGVQLRPSGHLRPKYIEVGSGPDNLPQYHTVLDLPLPGTKRGLKRSPSGWRGLFSRSNKQQRQRVSRAQAVSITPPQPIVDDMPMPSTGLRPVKSCESLQSESDTLAPLAERANAPLKQHTRSASCDSYFEPWQAELADMRLRLSPQERDHNIFSEEDDTVNAIYGVTGQVESLASTPIASALCSIEPSPRKNLRVDGLAANDSSVERRVNAIEEQLSSIGYIDGGESPRCKPSAEKRHSDGRTNSPQHSDIAKRVCKDRESPVASLTDFQTSLLNVKLRERNSPRKTKNSNRYSNVHHPASSTSHELSPDSKPRLSWHGKDGHSTLIQIHWPPDHSTGNLTTSTINSSPITPVTPAYDPLESDSEVSETNTKHTIKITERSCDSCAEEKCLKCELNATDFDDVKPELKEVAETNLHDSLEPSPAASTNVSYQNLNRLSAVSTSSNSEHTDKKNVKSAMTSSHESSSSYSNISPSKPDELYECYGFTRPSYINLHSSSTSKSSPTSPLKSPLKSTISITFRSPTKSSKTPEYELIENVDTPTNAERDSVYEDIDLEKNLSIVEDAPVPETDASLPTQQACQPEDYESDLIILETPIESGKHDENIDVYSQVKFFKKSIEEVNAMILESPEKEETVEARHYENVSFPAENDYENINVDALKICDKDAKCNDDSEAADDANAAETVEKENGNVIKSKVQKNLNVRELAIRFESPTEQKGPFVFEKFKAEVKYPSLERKVEDKVEIRQKKDVTVKIPPPISPKTYKLSKNSVNARSLDENAFTQEFGSETDRRKSFDVRDVKKQNKFLPDLNLNLEEPSKPDEAITPTSENKISLVQRFEKPDIKNLIGFDAEKKLSRERIEKYKEERRNFLREKYSSQSFRNSNPDQLTRLKIKKDEPEHDSTIDRLVDDTPKFERRNTVDLGQRMRFSLAKSTHNLDSIRSPTTPEKSIVSPVHDERFDSAKRSSRDVERKEKVSPSYNIRDMAAIFEQKSQNNASNG